MALSDRTKQALEIALGDQMSTDEILATGVELGDIPESQVTGLVGDLALKAPLASPTLTGVPAAPTAAPGTNTTQVATTAFVAALGALKAPLASPTFTGTVTLPIVVATLRNAADDAAAAALSPAIAVGGLYRNGSVVMVRVT